MSQLEMELRSVGLCSSDLRTRGGVKQVNSEIESVNTMNVERHIKTVRVSWNEVCYDCLNLVKARMYFSVQ